MPQMHNLESWLDWLLKPFGHIPFFVFVCSLQGLFFLGGYSLSCFVILLIFFNVRKKSNVYFGKL